MMEERARVVDAQGDQAQIEIERRPSCGACAASGACGTSLLERWLSRRRLQVRAMNPIRARPGEWVVVGLADEVLMQASLVVYLTPVLGLILGTAAGQALGGEPLAMLGAGMGLLAGLRGVWRFAERRRADPAYRAVILRRVANLPQRAPLAPSSRLDCAGGEGRDPGPSPRGAEGA